ncbi:hypothetical protein ACLB2K_025528 [Fragaria x ananassa]
MEEWFWQLDLLLDDLDFSDNQLSGMVLNSLRFRLGGTADLSGNHFSGPIPHNIGEVMPLLGDVDISRNSFTGCIPLSIGNLSRLSTLVISNNHLSGEVPDFWNSLSESVYLRYVKQQSIWSNAKIHGDP